jgi:hypothetical protein
MSRTYNRRAALQARRDREHLVHMVKQIATIVIVGFSLVSLSALACVVAYMVGQTL